ncbi:hypothetical protein KCP78_21615 [Salmonella enterica subsp. enterica]|nr:hypothetical protein KCP78_21615 [Salmonella enterica subsp. enterica]
MLRQHGDGNAQFCFSDTTLSTRRTPLDSADDSGTASDNKGQHVKTPGFIIGGIVDSDIDSGRHFG